MTEPARQSGGDAGPAATPATLPPERRLHDWRAAHDLAASYLDALGAPAAETREFAWHASAGAASDPHWSPGAGAIASTLRAICPLAADCSGSPRGAMSTRASGAASRST